MIFEQRYSSFDLISNHYTLFHFTRYVSIINNTKNKVIYRRESHLDYDSRGIRIHNGGKSMVATNRKEVAEQKAES